MKTVMTLLAASAVAMVTATSAGAEDLRKVSVGQVTNMTLSLAPLVAAQELGFFREEGLDVNVVEFKGTGTLIPQMVAKRVLIGYPNPDALIVSREPGKDYLPLEFFYNVTRESGWEFAVLADSKVKTIADLKGGKLGVGALTWGNIPITTALLAEHGIKVGQDIQMVPVGVGGPAFLALQNGSVDVLNLFDSQHATMEANGVKIRRLDMGQKYNGLFSNGFIAHDDTIRDEPKLLAEFGRAFTKGVVVCEVNPAYCVKTFWKHYPTQKPANGTEEEKIKAGIIIMEARTKKMSHFMPDEKHLYGSYSAQGWKDFIDVLKAGGTIKSADIDVNSLYTDALVPQFNDFDVAAVRKQAEGL